MRDNTVHVRRGKKHPSRMEMIVLAALAGVVWGWLIRANR